MAFPTSNATNTSLFQGADNSSAVLAASLTSSATSLTLSVASTFVNNQIILIDSEQIQITAGGGTTSLTVTRAMNGTTAASHSAGVQVLGVITAAHHNVLVAEIEAIESNVPALGSNNTFTGNNTFSGQLIAPSTILTSSATLGSASNYILNTSSIGQTATLPSSPTNGQEYLIANINTAPWTISASQGIFLAGTWGSSSVTSFTLPEGRSVGIVYNGTNWIQAYGTYQGSASSSGQVVSGFSGGIPTFTTVGGGSYGINDPSINSYTRSSYLFYPQSTKLVNAAVPDYYQFAAKTSELSPTLATMTDIIYSWNNLTHRSGNDSPSLNVLWGDMHVSISASKPAFAASLWNPDPDSNAQAFQKILALLKP